MPLPHCPHCLLPVADGERADFPPQAMRCPHCRLIIGAGRARGDATEDGDARSRGSAAGVLANAARRAQSAPGGRDEIGAALRAIADEVGCSVERLRLLDYQHEAEGASPPLPELGVVLATFGTWKAARAAAAVEAPAAMLDAEDDDLGLPPAVTESDEVVDGAVRAA
jgi:hypothetical protein